MINIKETRCDLCVDGDYLKQHNPGGKQLITV